MIAIQFGDEDAIDYGALKEKLLGDSNANLANANTGKLTTDHKIGSDVKFADFTYAEGRNLFDAFFRCFRCRGYCNAWQ